MDAPTGFNRNNPRSPGRKFSPGPHRGWWTPPGTCAIVKATPRPGSACAPWPSLFRPWPSSPAAPPPPSGSEPRSWPCFPGRSPARTSRWNWPPKFSRELGLTAEALQCGVHPPLHRPTAQALVRRPGLKPTPLHNTCTGKHTAMLALCVHHGWPIADYLNPAHQVQELILGTVARMVGFPKGQIQVAIDGCGAPVFYVLSEKHRPGICPPGGGAAGVACRRFDGGDSWRIPGTSPGTAAWKPRPWRPCRAGSLPSPAPKGAMVSASPKAAWGWPSRSKTAANAPSTPTVVAILDQMGVLTPAAAEALAAFREPPILNHRKEGVGRIRPAFTLRP